VQNLPFRRASVLFVVLFATAGPAAARADEPEPALVDKADRDSSLFQHDGNPNVWISGQANLITQAHPGFDAKYTGEQSLQADKERATSFVATLFTGFQLTSLTEALIDVEMAAGGGISTAFGMGGFTNLDVVRNPTLGSEPYLARIVLRQIVPLTSETAPVARGPFQVGASLPTRRLELAFGKLSTADFFDHNSAGSDSHLQFMNWAIDNNGAYDYAADTRGYTYGAVITYESPAFAARFGEMLMPTIANGIQIDWSVTKSHAENLELELRYDLAGRAGVLRLLGYLNHANMGRYRDAIDSFTQNPGADTACRASTEMMQDRKLPGPVIECHRQQSRTKAGAGVNFEQQVAGPLRAFGRLGWNDGSNESFAYTEVDDTLELGFDLSGRWWHRDDDKVGLAAVTNGLSAVHREYLALGGKGFLLGDGRLDYGRENIVELYYTALVGRGFSVAGDVQMITNPGYNRDRSGPLAVGSLRLHQEF
jgi:high affinity Mn2+ porin